MTARDLWKKAGDAFCEALFPEGLTCDVCGAELPQKGRLSLCATCFEHFPFVGEQICLLCGTPERTEADYCVRCMNCEFAFQKNRSVAVYEGEAKEMVLGLKYARKLYLVDTMTALMSDVFLSSGIAADEIAFVPMSAAERKGRGYNQSELLARRLGERLGLPVSPVLNKIKETKTQKEITGEQRAENLKNAFLCTDTLSGKKMLLVDDVFTTGATANECARALLKAKAKEVNCLTFAVTEHKLYTE